MKDYNDRLALIMSGGGARGAYEAGVIHYLRSGLPKEFRNIPFPIQCGASVGALNVSFLAATAQLQDRQGELLHDLWLSVKQEDVYYRDVKAVTSFLGNTLGGLTRNFVKLNPFNKTKAQNHFISVFNTAPFNDFLKKAINWGDIAANVKSGRVKVVSLVATRMKTGKTELFVQKNPGFEYVGPYKINEVNLDYTHAMASAAIPFVFPAIALDKHYYVDGGVRLNTPLSPAVQFGANKLLIVGLHSNAADKAQREVQAGLDANEQQPSMGEYLGKMLNGFFLDRMEYDIEQMNRINQIVERSEEVYGKDYLKKVNSGLRKSLRTGELVKRNFRAITYFKINPSIPISDVFHDWFSNHRKGKPHFTALENFLLRAFDINQYASMDLLSYLTFASDYIKMLLDLGYNDAKAKRDEIIHFFESPP